MSRRRFLRSAAGFGAGVAALGTLNACVAPAPASAPAGEAPVAERVELIHWHGLTASDGDIWNLLIGQFNEAHADSGVSILAEVVPGDELGTKVLGSFAAGTPPDFGWADGVNATYVVQGVIIELEELMTTTGLDLNDFYPNMIEDVRYQGKLYQIPMDTASIQMLINTAHAQEAGLDIAAPPQTGDELLRWAEAMTVREGDSVTRSGFLLTGSGTLPSYVWGTVAEQIGFQRFNEDYTQVNVVNDACREAAQWVLDLFDEYQVSNRDIADRYAAFGTGQGSIFWTGPWTLSGYMQQEGLEFTTTLMPVVGANPWTEGWISGLEIYQRDDAQRIQVTAEAITWLSDNSLVWCVEGRGPTPRKSIREMPEYTQGKTVPWELKQPFDEGLAFTFSAVPPVVGTRQFDYYGGAEKQLDAIWNKSATIDEGLQALQDEWQAILDQNA
jgi:ABC-type glycerol-3-phosphate transport system substrate-binding protein